MAIVDGNREVADDLLAEARLRLVELEEQQGDDDELGEKLDLAEGDAFRGRWRGVGQMRTREGDTLDVYLLWNEGGEPLFHYMNAAFVSEVDELHPEVGDEVAIARGPDHHFETKNGEPRTMKRFALAVRPCDDPLPGSTPDEDAKRDEFGF